HITLAGDFPSLNPAGADLDPLRQHPVIGLIVAVLHRVRHEVDVGSDGERLQLALVTARGELGDITDGWHNFPPCLSPGTIPCDGRPFMGEPGLPNPMFMGPERRGGPERHQVFWASASARSAGTRAGKKPGVRWF